MVNLSFILGSILVPFIVTAIVTLFSLGYFYRKRLEPMILEVTTFIEESKPVLETADKAIKTGMSAMGAKSGIVRSEKAVQKAVAGDLLNSKAPEIRYILEMLSPDTLEMLEENPEAAFTLIQRYGKLLGLETGQEQQQQTAYDL